MTFEARDSAAKIVPARFRKTFPEPRSRNEDTGVRHSSAQTKWETLNVYGAELVRFHHEKELSRRAMTSAFIRFSKTIQSSMDSTTEYYEMRGGPRSNLVKCPSAPSLMREFQQDEKRAMEAPRILRVSAFPRPPPRRRLSSNAYPRQTMSVDNPAVREVYSATYPAFIGEKGDEDMELGASATGVHRVDSDSSLALDLHLPQCAVTLSVRDSSRSPSATPLLEQVIVVPSEEVAGPSGLNSLHVSLVQEKVDKQTSTSDHNHLAMMGWSRDTWESKDPPYMRAKGGGSFREAKRPKADRKVKRSETIDTASNAHRKSHNRSHHQRSRAGSIRSTHDTRRLVPTRSETARRHQLLRQPKIEGSEAHDDSDKGAHGV
ncbi:UNVERIFIED_CONTAM: hypothetical protein GTU68_015863 [Idotea baltica]|nr:hypothetical protein [Idotea baltica]